LLKLRVAGRNRQGLVVVGDGAIEVALRIEDVAAKREQKRIGRIRRDRREYSAIARSSWPFLR
jgi:hypothetical protein